MIVHFRSRGDSTFNIIYCKPINTCVTLRGGFGQTELILFVWLGDTTMHLELQYGATSNGGFRGVLQGGYYKVPVDANPQHNV
jgi:hypothetical protein